MKNFANIQEFINFLETKSAKWPAIKHRALEAVGENIEKTARDKFGHYQEEIGDFPKWKQLTDATQADRARQGFMPNEPLLRTGELRDSITHQVKGDTVVIGSTSEVMVYQEVGTATIPPRPVLGAAAFESKKEVERVFLNLAMEYFNK